MVRAELHEVIRARKLNYFFDTEYGALVEMVMGELDKSFDNVEWWEIGTLWATKVVTIISISDGGF